ncbi:LLM class flavin-dependent oxidoreductase [Sphingobium sp. BS19]|uniref:LLM class flavin-dependent oxidoreductase n=1 Tax=Sphingobium sp. BS19 TaxID=3018973 RepID=UPI0022ED9F97|nr:LLM class flavin-dependent oxidoreductase [Sphingobium sp. BS19]GLJ00270.1 monooxygenase [Sphingobium sp. BS19]
MKLGMFMMPFHSLDRSYREMYDMDTQAAIHADACGFEELWVGEHYTAKVEPISNTLQFMSSLIPVTKNMKLCPGVLNLPQHNPVRVAADVAMFDNMSGGRFIMGIGPGGLGSDLEIFDTMPKDRNAMMIECAEMVQQIWQSNQAPFHLKGEYWNHDLQKAVHPDLGIGIIPKPLQDPFPAFCISAMSPHSGTAALAGTKGWNLISANFNAPWVIRSHWDVHSKAIEAEGRTADPSTWRVCRSILVTDTMEQANAFLADRNNSISHYYDYMVTLLRRTGRGRIQALLPTESSEEDDVSLQTCLDSMVIVGTPDVVAEKISAFRDEVGPFGTLLMAFHEWDDEALWRRSYELLAEKVLPAVNA